MNLKNAVIFRSFFPPSFLGCPYNDLSITSVLEGNWHEAMGSRH